MSSQQFNGLWDGFWNFLGGSWRVPQFWITSLLRQPSTVIVGVVIALCKTVWASIGKDRRNFESCQVKLSQNSQAKLRYSKISSTLHSFDGLYTGVNMSLQFQISGFGRQMGIISHWLLKNLNRIIMIKLINLLLQDSFQAWLALRPQGWSTSRAKSGWAVLSTSSRTVIELPNSCPYANLKMDGTTGHFCIKQNE